MTMSCKVCSHPSRKAIDRQILAGGNLREVSRTFNVSYDSLWRHKRDHIGPAAARGAQIAAQNHGDRLLADLDELLITGRRILSRAEESDDPKVALLALKESRQALMNIAQVSHAIWQAQQQNDTTIEVQEDSMGNQLFMEGYRKLSKRKQDQYLNLVIEALSLSNGAGDDLSANTESLLASDADAGEKSPKKPLVSSKTEDSELVVDPEDQSLKPRTVPRRKKDPDSDKPQMRRTRPPGPRPSRN